MGWISISSNLIIIPDLVAWMICFVQDGNLFTSNGPCSGLTTALRLVEVHCGTGYKNNLRELIEYKVPPVKGALVKNGEITNITV